ncbi:MAG: hypothetical protein K2I11_03875 [Bacteroides sp.]|nr:hypothetical protein [Bacteroides sp.]
MTPDDFLNHIKADGALNTPEIYQIMDEMNLFADMNNTRTFATVEKIRVRIAR